MHFSRQSNCWSLRCSWSSTNRCCSNYIFILHLTLGFDILCNYNCKPRWETFKFWDLVCFSLEIIWYVMSHLWGVNCPWLSYYYYYNNTICVVRKFTTFSHIKTVWLSFSKFHINVISFQISLDLRIISPHIYALLSVYMHLGLRWLGTSCWNYSV